MDDMSWIEYVAFGILLGLSIIVGLYYGCVEQKQNTVSDYLLGGKHMSVFPITMSLIVSHISGVTLLGVPAEVYTHGTQFLIISIMDVLVIVTVIYIFLPVFYELQFTSVYEYLERRFDSNIRVLSSLIYACSLLLHVPVVIYVAAVAFHTVTGVNLYLVVSIICVVCIFYTAAGGLKAVVWTDAIQCVFTTLTLIVVIILGLIKVGGITNMIKANEEGDRLELFKMDPNPFLRHTFWTVGLGMTFSWLAQLGIHPGAVQRFVALPTYGKAKNSIIYFLVGMSVMKLLTGTVGMLIYAKYKDCDPTMANYIKHSKYIVPYFVMDVASKFPGITGLFISGIVSAALSTMSAQLNTVSGTIYKDFVVKMISSKFSELTASIIMKCTVVIIGIFCVILVLIIERLKGLLQMSVSLSGVTAGGMLSVFTLGVCFPCVNSRGAMCGLLASLGITAWIVTGAQMAIYNNELKFSEKNISIAGCPANTIFKNHTDYSGLYRMNEDVYVSPNVWKIYTVSYQHYSTIGTIIGITVGLIVSLMFPTKQNVDPKLLAPFVRKLMYPENKDKSIVTCHEEHATDCWDTKL